MNKSKRKYSACFATPVSLNKAVEEMRRLALNGVHCLYFKFYLVSKIEHHESDVRDTVIMDACTAYNWIAGEYQAALVTQYIYVQLYTL